MSLLGLGSNGQVAQNTDLILLGIFPHLPTYLYHLLLLGLERERELGEFIAE